MNIHKLKIRSRLNIGIILLFIFSVIISILGILQVKLSYHQTYFIYDKSFLLGNSIRDLNNRIYQIHNICDNFLLSKDKNKLDSIMMQVNCLHNRNIELFDTIIFKLNSEKKITSELFYYYRKWYDSELNAILLCKSVNEIDKFNGICEFNLGELIQNTNNITEIIRKSASEKYSHAQQIEKRNTIIITIITIFLLALAQFFAIIVSRSISIPLIRVNKNLKETLNQNDLNNEKFSNMNELELIEHSTNELKNAYGKLNEEVKKRKIAEEKIEEQFKEIENKNIQLRTFNSELKHQIELRTKELSDSEMQYRTLFEKAIEGIVFMNFSGKIIAVNEAYAKMHGYTKEEVLNKNINEINTEKSAMLFPQRVKQLLEGESLQIEVEHYHKNGSIITLDVSACHVTLNGENYIFSFHKNISDYKKHQIELQESEERYRTLFEKAIEGIFIISLSGQIIAVNEAYAKLHGYTKEEILKMNLLDFDTPESAKHIPDRMQQILKGNIIKFESEHYHKNKSIITLDVSACLVKINNENYAVAFHRDITELKQKTAGLKVLQQAVETTSEVVFITDNSGYFTYINPQFTRLYGYTSEEVLNKCTPKILKSGLVNAEKYEKFWEDIVNNKIINIEFINRTKDGKFLFIECSANAIYDIENRLIGFLSIQRDITERKKIQEELISAKEKAEESDRLKSAFLANMSHEIRTPLNGIVGFSDMLAKPNIPEYKKIDYQNIIKNCSNQLLTIISDIIDISKIEANQIRIIESNVNINVLLQELYSIFNQKIILLNVTLSYIPDISNPELTIITDKNRLKQILINLIDNAIKFTSEGEVKYGYVIKEDSVEFFVEDTGIGIEESNREIIFEPFRQAEGGLSRNFGGTGLGLSISRALIKLLHGNIWFTSEVQKGTKFCFNIPLNKGTIMNIETEKKTLTKNIHIGNKIILIAEDELPNFKLLDAILIEMGFKTIHAKNGLEAVNLAISIKEIDMIFMDIKMPIMNGYQALHEIKKQRPSIPIVAQTAYAQIQDKEKAIESGFDDYIAKPIQQNELNIIIEKFFTK